ncbi:hypothetical protein HK102_003666, partial [Quaeritorhiza haematococci]
MNNLNFEEQISGFEDFVNEYTTKLNAILNGEKDHESLDSTSLVLNPTTTSSELPPSPTTTGTATAAEPSHSPPHPKSNREKEQEPVLKSDMEKKKVKVEKTGVIDYSKFEKIASDDEEETDETK